MCAAPSCRAVQAFQVVNPYSTAIAVAHITDWSAFASLRAEWNALAAKCAMPSVFLTHEWFDAAWQWKGRESYLHALCARRDGKLVGALPLVHSVRKSRSGRRRVMEFLTVPDTQLCDLLVLPNERRAVADSFASALAQSPREWDMLDFSYLPEGSVTETDLVPRLHRHVHNVAVEDAGSNPYIDLEGTWEAYYAARSRSLKKASNLAANRLAKAGEVKIEWHEPGAVTPAQVPSLLEKLVSISGRSWKRETGNSLDHPGPQAFIRKLSEHAAQRNWLSVWTLDLNGSHVAMEYQLVFERNVHALRSDFDAALGEISPGSHLNRQLMERLFCGRFHRYYMGPGENAYKLRWTNRSELLRRATVYARTARGRLAAAVDLRVAPLARRVRATLRRNDAAPKEMK
jgi:CelD/BcsL family acetyltransferase involved in cellulose biosynthesis